MPTKLMRPAQLVICAKALAVGLEKSDEECVGGRYSSKPAQRTSASCRNASWQERFIIMHYAIAKPSAVKLSDLSHRTRKRFTFLDS